MSRKFLSTLALLCSTTALLTQPALAGSAHGKMGDMSFKTKITGFTQVDEVFHIDDTVDHSDGTAVRRARLGVKGHMDSWGYKFDYDFASHSEIKDLYLTYEGFNSVKLTLGQFKEPIGLEWQTSPPHKMFMESALVSAFTPERSIGGGIIANFNQLRFNLGLFGRNANNEHVGDEGYSADIHAVYAPIHQKHHHLHLGLSSSYRTPNGDDKSVSYYGQHEKSLTNIKSVYTKSIENIDYTLLSGVEGLWVYGPYSLQAEYLRADVNRDSGFSDESFQSYYAQISWMLTGESHMFDDKKHSFMGVKPLKPVSGKGHGMGAWELAFRYDNLDLCDDSVKGGEMDRYTLGLNWYPNDHVRFMLNYLVIDTDKHAAVPSDSTQAVGFRTQVTF